MFQPRKLIAAVTVSGAVVPLSTKKPPETVLCFNLLGVAVDEGGEEDESIQTIDIPHKYDRELNRPVPCQSTGGVEIVELGPGSECVKRENVFRGRGTYDIFVLFNFYYNC